MDAMPSQDIDTLVERVHDLEATLRQNDLTLARMFCLTPAMANLLGLLLSLEVVTSDIVQQRLGISTEAKVAIHRLRKSLKTFGIEIITKRKLGYWLDDATKRRINDAIAQARQPLRPPPHTPVHH